MADDMNAEIEKAKERGRQLNRPAETMTPEGAVAIAIERVTDLDLSLDEGEDTTALRFIAELRSAGYELRPR